MQGLSWFPGAWLAVDRTTTRILAASGQVAELLGGTKERYVGHSIMSLKGIARGDDRSLKQLDPAMLGREGRYEDIGLQRADGSVIGVDVQVAHPHRRTGILLAICFLTDQTEQRRLASRLIAKHQELRREYSKLSENTEKNF